MCWLATDLSTKRNRGAEAGPGPYTPAEAGCISVVVRRIRYRHGTPWSCIPEWSFLALIGV